MLNSQKGFAYVFGLFSILLALVVLIILFFVQQNSLEKVGDSANLKNVINDAEEKANQYNQRQELLNRELNKVK